MKYKVTYKQVEKIAGELFTKKYGKDCKVSYIYEEG